MENTRIGLGNTTHSLGSVFLFFFYTKQKKIPKKKCLRNFQEIQNPKNCEKETGETDEKNEKKNMKKIELQKKGQQSLLSFFTANLQRTALATFATLSINQ